MDTNTAQSLGRVFNRSAGLIFRYGPHLAVERKEDGKGKTRCSDGKEISNINVQYDVNEYYIFSGLGLVQPHTYATAPHRVR